MGDQRGKVSRLSVNRFEHRVSLVSRLLRVSSLMAIMVRVVRVVSSRLEPLETFSRSRFVSSWVLVVDRSGISLILEYQTPLVMSLKKTLGSSAAKLKSA